jgi:hypothetical protein
MIDNNLIRSKPDDGDAHSIICQGIKEIIKFYEIKSSFSQKTEEFRLTHIRDYQSFDCFIICYVDVQDNFKQYYYILEKSFICENPDFTLSAMDNTQKANLGNTNINKAMTIKKDDAFYFFGQGNLLNGTSYNDLLNYFK